MISHDVGMEFGVKKCGVAIMKRGKLVESKDINLGNGESTKAIDLEGYKYLGILEAHKIKGNEIKEMFSKEYLRRTKQNMRSKLNCRNNLMAVNVWAVSFMRQGACILGWNTNELQSLTENKKNHDNKKEPHQEAMLQEYTYQEEEGEEVL